MNNRFESYDNVIAGRKRLDTIPDLVVKLEGEKLALENSLKAVLGSIQ